MCLNKINKDETQLIESNFSVGVTIWRCIVNTLDFLYIVSRDYEIYVPANVCLLWVKNENLKDYEFPTDFES